MTAPETKPDPLDQPVTLGQLVLILNQLLSNAGVPVPRVPVLTPHKEPAA